MKHFLALFLLFQTARAGEVLTVPNFGALQSATPAQGGQMAIVSNGGIGFGFRPIAGGFVLDGVSIFNPQIYGNDLYFHGGYFNAEARAPVIRADYLAAKAAYFNGPGGYKFIASGAVYVDNTLMLHNTTGGYSSITAYHPEDDFGGGRAWAIGIGPHRAAHYGDRMFLATNPAAANVYSAPPDILFAQEQASDTYHPHYRMLMDARAKTITLYGWSDREDIGPVALCVNPDGSLAGPTISSLLAEIAAIKARLTALENQ